MSFKIVKLLGKRNILIVPERCEKNGVFWYPPFSWSTRQRRQVLQNKFSRPNKSTWPARPCVLMKSKISTYELAEEQEELLVGTNDSNLHATINLRSEGQSDVFEPIPIPMLAEIQTREFPSDEIWDCLWTSSFADFRSKLQTIQNRAASPSTNPTEIPATHLDTPNDGPLIESEIKMEALEFVCIEENSAKESNSEPTRNALRHFENYQRLQQEDISKQFKEMKSCITNGFKEVFTQLKTLAQIQYSNSLSTVCPDIYPKKFCIENFKKVSTCEEANRLEKLLMISEYKADMIAKMGIIIGITGSRIGDGLDCCYDLIEMVFERKFLKICSWTGASTSGMEDAKIAFLKYKNIISFFASVIMNADPEFSFEKTKEFFRNVLWTASTVLAPSIQGQQNRESTSKVINIEGYDEPETSNKRKSPSDSESETHERENISKKDDVRIDEILATANRRLNNITMNLNGDNFSDESVKTEYR